MSYERFSQEVQGLLNAQNEQRAYFAPVKTAAVKFVQQTGIKAKQKAYDEGGFEDQYVGQFLQEGYNGFIDDMSEKLLGPQASKVELLKKSIIGTVLGENPLEALAKIYQSGDRGAAQYFDQRAKQSAQMVDPTKHLTGVPLAIYQSNPQQFGQFVGASQEQVQNSQLEEVLKSAYAAFDANQ